MAKTLPVEQRELIQKLLEMGWEKRKIARETGISRNTVRKYTDDKKEESPVDPPGSRSVCFQFESIILDSIEKGLSAQRIYQDLKREYDFSGSYVAVRRFVALKRPKKTYYCRIHTEPGEEAQVDFGQGAPVSVDGKERKPWLFVMVLGYSRVLYTEAVWEQDLETFIRCHERAFQAFGGVPQSIRLDNLKAGVLKANLFDPELNFVYRDFAAYYGFTPLPCRVATPEHKGKVESSVKHVQNNALKAKHFQTLEEQNAELRRWSKDVANPRKHGTTKQTPFSLFEEERNQLQALPEKEYTYFKTSRRSVHNDGHIEVDGAYYSVPHTLVGKWVEIHVNAAQVKVLVEGRQVALHRRRPKGSFQTESRHLPPGSTFDECLNGAIERMRSVGSHCTNWGEMVLEANKKVGLRNILGALSLIDVYGSKVVENACEMAMNGGYTRYVTIKLFCEGLQPKKTQKIERKAEPGVLRSLEEYEHIIDSILTKEG